MLGKLQSNKGTNLTVFDQKRVGFELRYRYDVGGTGDTVPWCAVSDGRLLPGGARADGGGAFETAEPFFAPLFEARYDRLPRQA